MRGKFITFEGSEGSGKSTQAKMLLKYLLNQGVPAILIREPGSTKISEKIRKILLDPKNKSMCDEAEMLLYMASRAQLVREIIIPALKKGKFVISDRFLDATLCYQGYGGGLDIDLIKRLGRFVTAGIKPHLTFLLDIDAKKGLERAGKYKDRIEQKNLVYHKRVRRGYLHLSRLEPKRIKLVPVSENKMKTQEIIRKFTKELL
ncbi:MAG: dTMP kinase [Candidatus Omnitrophota bacterium]|nr:dTMP kinase [Candidatus Omnitrophota bacterium]